MFRNILTPLTSKFPFPTTSVDIPEPLPENEEEEGEQAPEDFERDARIEEMRIVLEDIKSTPVDDVFRKYQVSYFG
jgi:hypothetical protein